MPSPSRTTAHAIALDISHELRVELLGRLDSLLAELGADNGDVFSSESLQFSETARYDEWSPMAPESLGPATAVR